MTTPHPPAESADRLRVLFAYSYSMHYRLGVFRALLEQPGVDVTVAAGRTPDPSRRTRSRANADVAPIAPIDPSDLPDLQWHHTIRVGPVRFQPGLLRRSLSSRYDVVVWDPSIHCATVWLSSAIIRARQQTLVYWGLGWTAAHGPVKERLKVTGFRLAHGFATYDTRSAELAVAAGYPPRRLHVVGNSVIDSAQARAVAASGMPSPEPLVLGVALRLTPRKKVDLLLRAVASLNATGVAARAIVVGDGPELPALRDLAAELGVEVDFTGALYDVADVAEFYRQIHLTVIPGHAGLTVLASLMHGRPVITHDNPDHHAAEWEAIRDGVSGRLFVEDDLDDLVASILAVRDQVAADPAGMAQECRADYLEHGAPDAHAKRIIAAVRAVIADRAHPGSGSALT